MPLPLPLRVRAAALARPSARLAALPALFAFGVVSCSDTDPTAPAGARLSRVAAAYIDTAIDWEQEMSYYTSRIDWPKVRRDAPAKTPTAQTMRDAYPAVHFTIDSVLRPLGDNHSLFFPRESSPGLVDAPDSSPRNIVTASSTLVPGIAYLSVPGFTGRNLPGRADSTLTLLRQLDATAPCGWILDLRMNLGGYFGAIMSGLSPLVANSRFGGVRFADGGELDFFIQDGSVGFFDPVANRAYAQTGSGPVSYRLQRPNAPVAILQGINTASAGEILVLAFRGGTVPYRTFGAPTRGATSSPIGTYLPDSAYLNITAGLWYDRSKTLLNGAIPPDQAVAGPSVPTPGQNDAVVQAATTWLQSRPECAAAPAAATPPARSLSRERVVPAPVPASEMPRNRRLSPIHALRTVATH